MRALRLGFVLALFAGCGSVSSGPDGGGGGDDDAPVATCAVANPCDTNATCTDSAAGPTCACNAGFTGNGMTCADVNECATNNGGCDTNATCSNLVGSRTCTCQPGFVGDGLTCRQVWVRVAMLPGTRINPDNFGALATGAGSKLYFGPRSNDSTQLYFRSFDVGTSQVSGALTMPPGGTSSDFCACGLTSVLVSTGNVLYLLGNQGQRYDTVTGRWATVTNYADPNRRGEAAAAFDAASSMVLLIGGRGNEGSAIHMTVPNEVFSAEPGALPVGMSSAVAFTPPGAPVTYAAGGDLGQGRAIVSHTTGAGGWTRLADAPQSLSRPIGMGGYMNRIWVATPSGDFFFYNPATDTWLPTPIAGPPGTTVATMVAGQVFVLADTGSATEIYRLNSIQ